MWRLVLVALLACKSKTQQPPPAPDPSHDDPWTDIRVPGASVFTLHGDHVAYLVRDGATDHLRGNDAMRVVVDSKLTDPTQLATFSELFSERVAGRVVRSPRHRRRQRARRRARHRARDQGRPADVLGGVGRRAPPRDARPRHARARQRRRRRSRGRRRRSRRHRAQAASRRTTPRSRSPRCRCSPITCRNAAGAAALLVETLRSAARADTRAAAATALETCPGDLAAARDALTRAASDPDETVSYAAKGALARLP